MRTKPTKTVEQRNKLYQEAYLRNARAPNRYSWGQYICWELSKLKYGNSWQYDSSWSTMKLEKDFPEFALFRPSRKNTDEAWFKLGGRYETVERENDWRLTVLGFCIAMTGGLK